MGALEAVSFECNTRSSKKAEFFPCARKLIVFNLSIIESIVISAGVGKNIIKEFNLLQMTSAQTRALHTTAM